MQNESFIFHASWAEVLGGLPGKVRLKVLDAIVRYGVGRRPSQLKCLAAQAFATIKQEIDLDREREAKRHAQRRAWSAQANAKRWAKQRGKAQDASVSPTGSKVVPIGETRMESQFSASAAVDENAKNRGGISVSPTGTTQLPTRRKPQKRPKIDKKRPKLSRSRVNTPAHRR